MAQQETIAAVATPHGKGALAIIRVSGRDSFAVVARCLEDADRFTCAKPRVVTLYAFRAPGERRIMDEITAIKYAAPKSFTGENMVEIVCHGGPGIVGGILESLLLAGARPAGRGAFTRRAMENGKFGILKAEAIRAMIESASEAELLCARKLYEGEGYALARWRERLIALLAGIEARIEFGEEDGVREVKERGEQQINDFLIMLEKEIKKKDKINVLMKGLTVVIAGPVNAGKSTLFNRLVGFNRVITHHTPGTTRDLVSEQVRINGHEVRLIDSAGIRATEDDLEIEGIKRSREAINSADILIWVTSADEPFRREETDELLCGKERKKLVVINKTDIRSGIEKEKQMRKWGEETVMASLLKQTGTDLLLEKISRNIEAASREVEIPDLFLNRRHEEIGRKIYSELLNAKEEWGRPEIAAVHIKKSVSYFDEIFGTVNTEEVLNIIFEGFCIGK